MIPVAIYFYDATNVKKIILTIIIWKTLQKSVSCKVNESFATWSTTGSVFDNKRAVRI